MGVESSFPPYGDLERLKIYSMSKRNDLTWFSLSFKVS